MENKTTNPNQKDMAPRSYDAICKDIEKVDTKKPGAIDRFITLLNELKTVKGLTDAQASQFFSSVNEVFEDAWAPFLTKASLQIDPNKMGNNFIISSTIIDCCAYILEDHGLSGDELFKQVELFKTTKDEKCITSFLKFASQFDPKANPNANEKFTPPKISPQELACVTFIYFNLECRHYFQATVDPLLKIDHAIAEFFSLPIKNTDLKDLAGKTLGNILSAREFSRKKLSALTYLYADTTEELCCRASKIANQQEAINNLKARNELLTAELNKWKADNADLVSHMETLEAENEQLRQKHSKSENRLEYERDIFERQMRTKEEGIAKQLTSTIHSELQAVREIAERVDENNQRRIFRRLDRIDEFLKRFGGNR